MKAIDVHGHFGPYDRGAGGLRDCMLSGSIEVVRRRAHAADICLTVVSATHALMPYGGDVWRGNEDAREVSEQHPDIRFWAVLNPQIRETYKQVESLLTHPRCRGIKIHPFEHTYEIRDYGDEIFEFAASHKALIITHSGCPGSFPEDFIRFTNQYPDVPLIFAHLGNSADGNLSRQVYALKQAKTENVHIDTSSANSIYSGLIEWAVSQVGAQHLLFGTDTPLYFAACQKARIEHAEIDENAKQAILFDNAARLLHEE
ncbi:MAG: amidohydrolase family protein [Nitrososphaera sp.]|nr:amidohydrolase family protein [Nitrososphaera sp.]